MPPKLCLNPFFCSASLHASHNQTFRCSSSLLKVSLIGNFSLCALSDDHSAACHHEDVLVRAEDAAFPLPLLPFSIHKFLASRLLLFSCTRFDKLEDKHPPPQLYFHKSFYPALPLSSLTSSSPELFLTTNFFFLPLRRFTRSPSVVPPLIPGIFSDRCYFSHSHHYEGGVRMSRFFLSPAFALFPFMSVLFFLFVTSSPSIDNLGLCSLPFFSTFSG